MLRGIAKYQSSHEPWAAYLDDQGQAEVSPGWLMSRQWDGVISRHATRRLAAECRRLQIPLVDLNDEPAQPESHKIRPDNVAIGHMGAEHFIERGYRNFGFCGYSNEEWALERRRGFVEGLTLAGFSASLLECKYPGASTPDWNQEQVLQIAAWLVGLSKPLAIMGCHDLHAAQILEGCQLAGVAVPEEVAVLGANDDAIRCELSNPPLSSVATNSFLSGFTAAELLDQLMRGRKIKPAESLIEPIRVVVRNSTDTLAIDDRTVTEALGYIRDNACLGISVSNVVDQVAASRSQLEKKFRQYLGRSPQAEIRQVQLGKTKQLLHETDFPLKKIAELVGFEHPEYLSVVFKRVTKLSPGAYRRLAQNEQKPRAAN
jgi:LacI family transcriptional regulator